MSRTTSKNEIREGLLEALDEIERDGIPWDELEEDPAVTRQTSFQEEVAAAEHQLQAEGIDVQQLRARLRGSILSSERDDGSPHKVNLHRASRGRLWRRARVSNLPFAAISMRRSEISRLSFPSFWLIAAGIAAVVVTGIQVTRPSTEPRSSLSATILKARDTVSVWELFRRGTKITVSDRTERSHRLERARIAALAQLIAQLEAGKEASSIHPPTLEYIVVQGTEAFGDGDGFVVIRDPQGDIYNLTLSDSAPISQAMIPDLDSSTQSAPTSVKIINLSLQSTDKVGLPSPTRMQRAGEGPG